MCDAKESPDEVGISMDLKIRIHIKVKMQCSDPHSNQCGSETQHKKKLKISQGFESGSAII
jgi:hypothetical protein